MEDCSYKRVTIAFLQLANHMYAHIAEILQPLNVSYQQLKVLGILEGQLEGCTTVNHIREHMGDPMSNVSRLLNKMVEKALIEKRRSDSDQRVVYVQITANGRSTLKEGSARLDAALRTLCKLNEDELAQFEQLLAQLRGAK